MLIIYIHKKIIFEKGGQQIWIWANKGDNEKMVV